MMTWIAQHMQRRAELNQSRYHWLRPARTRLTQARNHSRHEGQSAPVTTAVT